MDDASALLRIYLDSLRDLDDLERNIGLYHDAKIASWSHRFHVGVVSCIANPNGYSHSCCSENKTLG